MSFARRPSSGMRAVWLADSDLKARQHKTGDGAGWLATLSLAWASIGIIFGDIGTSPLYVYSTIFDSSQPSQEDVLCATSLIFWSITLVVMVKYVFIVLQADDNGEGGTFALYATICRACGIPPVNAGPMPADKQLYEAVSAPQSVISTPINSMRQLQPPVTSQACEASEGTKHLELAERTDAAKGFHNGQDHQLAAQLQPQLTGLGRYLRDKLSHSRAAQKALLGVTLLLMAMVLGDGVLTPSISVLSAVSGLQVKAGLTSSAVVGITCAILVGLFGIQSWGTQRVGVLFAPTVALFFLSNILVGLYNICKFEGGAVFRALSPHYIGIWFQNHGTEGWMRMAGVFLCLTGCEALFADLGHFSRRSIQLSFTLGVYPSLVLTYLGQASWLMHHLDGYATVFYSSLPTPVFWPVFVVSVLASIVASQALITGAFSLVWQSMAMGCFPRFRVHHTSEEIGGQIYISEVNYTLLLLCVAVVAGFRSGTAIGNAYGIAVNMVMLATVFMVSLVMLVAWGTRPLLVLLFLAPFAFIEGVFLSANILNIPHGGWFSITLAVVLTTINVLWIWGTAEKASALKREQLQLSDLLTTKPPSHCNPSGISTAMSSQGWRLFRASNGAPVHRNPGMALVYSESPFNVPPVFTRLVESWGLHSIVVFMTVHQVPIPHVGPQERLLLAPLEFRGFYQCVARYGYMDAVDQGELFAQSILDKIAQQVPTHALADGVLMPRRPNNDMSTSSPHHQCLASAQHNHHYEAGNAVSMRAVPHLQPPSIAEELPASHCGTLQSADGTQSGSGSGSGSKGSSGSGASFIVEISVQCSAQDLHEQQQQQQQHAAPSTGSGSVTGPSTSAAVVPVQPHDGAEDPAHSELTHHDDPGTAAIPQQQPTGSCVEHLIIPTAAEPAMGLPRSTSLHRRTTWEARRTVEGPAAVSPLAANAVYVLHRSIIHVRPANSGSSKATQCVRRLLIEVVYQQLWQLTTRFWEGWKVPPARMFEVGMLLEI